MIEILLILTVTFGGGYWTGHENPSVSCIDTSLVTANCIELQPPVDDSFGAMTSSYIDHIGIYKRCKASCVAAK